MAYIEYMQDLANETFRPLFDGVKRVRMVDFPDHPNVGDSAISLGQFEFFDKEGIDVCSVHCIGTFQRHLLREGPPVVINGGGNIAGFFDGIDQHRNRFGRKLSPETLLIQAPQSIHFESKKAQVEFERDFLTRARLRIAARDNEGQRSLSGRKHDVFIAPDAVHHLGLIKALDPVRRFVVLKRADRESNTAPSLLGVDWPKDGRLRRGATWMRWKLRYMDPLGEVLNPSPAQWRRIANARFSRGVEILSQGEVVVTDRLHAMLIGLQMGRQVIAVDNSNQKLSKYANTWFGPSNPQIKFAQTFDQAIGLAGRRSS